LGVLLAVSATLVIAPMTHLVSESGPKTLHPCYKHILKQFEPLKNDPYAPFPAYTDMAQIGCKTGHFVSAKHSYVWHTQWVGSGQFFSTKLS